MRGLAAVTAMLGFALLAPLGAPTTGDAAYPMDEAWLREAYATYQGLPGFVDVAYVMIPTPHVGVFFAGAIPAHVDGLHSALETRTYTLAAEPVMHDAIVPFMHLLAQDLPAGIRPGAWMLGPHPCTMSFVVRDTPGNTYILTAGHCVDFVGQDVSVTNHGVVGKVVAFRNAGVGQDYALVKINANTLGEVNPRTAGWGGPVGVVAANPGPLVNVKHYGWGALTWPTHESRCRLGAGATVWGTTFFGWDSVVIWGDSGSEIMTGAGAALGIVTHLSTIPPATGLGTRVTHALSSLGTQLGTTFTVVDGGPVEPVCAHT